jgi:carbon-monoxide dehydrogenase medium subunit
MKPARFEYVRPRSLAETLDLLARHSADASILAGGQSLMPMLNLRMSKPAILIDINALSDMDAIERHGDRIVAIRNRGTLGGSLALADPAAEMPACAVCLDAEIFAVSARGERMIPAGQFFDGLYSTVLKPDELIHRVSYPLPDESWHVHFDEVARRRGDFALAALALRVKLEDDHIADCRIVFAGVEAFPRRVTSVEDALIGLSLHDLDARAAAVELLDQSLSPLEEGEYPAAYRLQLARVLLTRLLGRIGRENA